MSTTELSRAGVLARVMAETLTLRSAAALMTVSYRQAKRLYARYRTKGAAGLRHGRAGPAAQPTAAAPLPERGLAPGPAEDGSAVREGVGSAMARRTPGGEGGVAG